MADSESTIPPENDANAFPRDGQDRVGLDPARDADETGLQGITAEEGAAVSRPTIQVRDLHKSFGDNEVLRGISLDVDDGTTAVVMGGSGSGKSVLIKTIVGLLKPDSGRVWIKNQRVDELESLEMDKVRLSIGYLFQSGALFDSMTVAQNLGFILERHSGLSKIDRAQRIQEALEWVRLPEKALSYPSELSGGQQKRIALARAIVLQPSILLYDEPTTGLDPISVRTVSELIVKLRDERGITSIVITHDLLCAQIVADEAHFINEGVIAESGSVAELSRSTLPIIRTFFQEDR